jgi:F0F1-type ATP synthase membrane subunit a
LGLMIYFCLALRKKVEYNTTVVKSNNVTDATGKFSFNASFIQIHTYTLRNKGFSVFFHHYLYRTPKGFLENP